MANLRLFELLPQFGAQFGEAVAKERWTVFAYALVPSLTIGYWLTPPEILGRRGDASENITTVALNSSYDAGTTQDVKKQSMLIVEADPEEYVIPWSEPVSRFESSLTAVELSGNATRFELLPDPAIWLKTPLFGIDRPFAILVDGEPAGVVLTPGSRISAADIQLEARANRARANSLVLAAIIATFFGLGMTTGMGGQAKPSD